MGVLSIDNPEDFFCSDYTLHDDEDTVWITVGSLSVYIRRNDEGVSADIFGRGMEAEAAIAGCWALFSEAEYEDEPGD